MGIGEFVGVFFLGIMSTGIIATQPEQLPLLILGAIIIAIFTMKGTNFANNKINELSWGFLILTTIGGIFATIGLIILLSTQNLFLILNGLSWIGMGVVITKYNLDGAW